MTGIHAFPDIEGRIMSVAFVPRVAIDTFARDDGNADKPPFSSTQSIAADGSKQNCEKADRS